MGSGGVRGIGCKVKCDTWLTVSRRGLPPRTFGSAGSAAGS